MAYLCIFFDGIVDHIMIWSHLFLLCITEIFHSQLFLLKVHVTETTVEKNFAGVEFELQAQLLIVDVGVSSEVQKGVVEVGQSLFEVADEEIRDALLEICHSQILIELDCTLVAFHLFLSVGDSLAWIPGFFAIPLYHVHQWWHE